MAVVVIALLCGTLLTWGFRNPSESRELNVASEVAVGNLPSPLFTKMMTVTYTWNDSEDPATSWQNHFCGQKLVPNAKSQGQFTRRCSGRGHRCGNAGATYTLYRKNYAGDIKATYFDQFDMADSHALWKYQEANNQEDAEQKLRDILLQGNEHLLIQMSCNPDHAFMFERLPGDDGTFRFYQSCVWHFDLGYWLGTKDTMCGDSHLKKTADAARNKYGRHIDISRSDFETKILNILLASAKAIRDAKALAAPTANRDGEQAQETLKLTQKTTAIFGFEGFDGDKIKGMMKTFLEEVPKPKPQGQNLPITNPFGMMPIDVPLPKFMVSVSAIKEGTFN